MHGPFRQPQGVLGYMHEQPRSKGRWVFWGLVILLCTVALAFLATFMVPQGRDGEPVTLAVPGDIDAAVQTLRDAGVLQYPLAFRTLLRIRERTIQNGQYTLSSHLSVWSLVRLLTTTQARVERTIRITEGWNLRDIAAYLDREGFATYEEFLSLTGVPAVDYRFAEPGTVGPKDFSDEFPFLQEKPEFLGLEGYLFPDTYRVFADASPEDIVRKMLTNFDQKLTPELREEIASSDRSLQQVITMASIIEAEIAVPEDRPVAAGILWKRRDRGMLLQVDATVNYVTGKHDPSVSRADTGIDSSFNTYRYAGLPRGPIGNPGMDAILATLRPMESPYWFFLTTNNGQTIFSRTLDEHNRNVAKYLR